VRRKKSGLTSRFQIRARSRTPEEFLVRRRGKDDIKKSKPTDCNKAPEADKQSRRVLDEGNGESHHDSESPEQEARRIKKLRDPSDATPSALRLTNCQEQGKREYLRRIREEKKR